MAKRWIETENIKSPQQQQRIDISAIVVEASNAREKHKLFSDWRLRTIAGVKVSK
ncbi:hypothetical protein HanIR_Chr10g0497451 [Helianthus annuus]|nr:hypothetical protein HanIR_Chr10g0497451 [Helianthus annuus]